MADEPVQSGTKRDTFVSSAVVRVLRYAEFGAASSWIDRFFGLSARGDYRFYDVWVLGWTIGAVAIFIIVSSTDFPTWLQMVVAAVSAARVYDYLLYVLGTLFGAFPRKGHGRLRSYKRLVILLMCDYLETIFWFATWYTMLGFAHLLVTGPKTLTVLRESLVLMVANSTGKVEATSSWSLALVTLNSAIGLFLTSVVVAYFVSLLPRPGSMDESERVE